MIIGVPREVKADEHRVGLLPSAAYQLTQRGHRVIVETEAGMGSGYPDADYTDAGAVLSKNPDDIFAEAELIVKVKEPQPEEVQMFRGFDVPFLYLRSAVLDVPVTRKDWLGYRFQTQPHCDLADQLTFYNVGGWGGAARRFNLDFYCKAFGIPSPKAEGVTGMDINDLIQAGRFQEIADYCVRDVVATTRLYKIWEERLAGVK